MVSDKRALGIAVAGLGTVGASVARLIQQQADVLAARCGRPARVVAVCARDRRRDRGVDLGGATWFDDPVHMARAADGADVFVELIGGEDGPALEACRAALEAGRHVVTANKALIARHGSALAALAARRERALMCEAAVAGAVPVLKTVREGLAGNRISSVRGILNGTCNYILSTMFRTGQPFDAALAEAQRLGYAEADPTFDVDGVDTAHKLCILAALAFGARTSPDMVAAEGIRGVTPADVAHARATGHTIKLLGVAEDRAEGLSLRAHPVMIPRDDPLAAVDGARNAVMVEADFAGPILLQGHGAGGAPTASAVVADIVDIARAGRGLPPPLYGAAVDSLADKPLRPPGTETGQCYVRLRVRDRPGVLADVSAVLRDAGISIESVAQSSASANGADGRAEASLAMTLHRARESDVRAALGRIAALDAALEAPGMIRMAAA